MTPTPATKQLWVRLYTGVRVLTTRKLPYPRQLLALLTCRPSSLATHKNQKAEAPKETQREPGRAMGTGLLRTMQCLLK